MPFCPLATSISSAFSVEYQKSTPPQSRLIFLASEQKFYSVKQALERFTIEMSEFLWWLRERTPAPKCKGATGGGAAVPVSPKGLTGIDSSDKPRFFRSAGGVTFEMYNIQTQHALTSKYVHIFNVKCSKEALRNEDFCSLPRKANCGRREYIQTRPSHGVSRTRAEGKKIINSVLP